MPRIPVKDIPAVVRDAMGRLRELNRPMMRYPMVDRDEPEAADCAIIAAWEAMEEVPDPHTCVDCYLPHGYDVHSRLIRKVIAGGYRWS